MAITGFNMADFAADQNSFTGALDGSGRDMENDPFVKGYAFIRWVKVPSWISGTGGPYPNFAQFCENNFKGFDQLSDIDMTTESVSSGFNANEYHIAGGIQKANTDFTIKFQEYSGSPVRAMFQYWVSGMRDPETGLATYVAATGGNYGAKHHTGELLYIVTRPDAHNANGNNIEFAAYYTSVMPTKIALNHLNYSIGDRTAVEIDMPFKGNLHMSPRVDALAETMLKATTFGYKALGDWDLTVTRGRGGI